MAKTLILRAVTPDFRTRNFNSWKQLFQLFFRQLTSQKSLRDICFYLIVPQEQTVPPWN
ncbi:DUF4372 domain-containing protein [Mucilaginibacter psychrotolerans]|uniref:DUF4372 domain-containing protein n=1 Tax=Mucilaginibacter psychrotolerans TaxID=1524096 RepID=UPI0013050FE1